MSGTKGKLVRALALTLAVAGLSRAAAADGFVYTALDMAKSPANEKPAKAFDGNKGSKWLAFTPTAWLQVEAPAAVKPAAYALTSANDEPPRDPKSWKLLGSDDGQTFVELDARADQVFAGRFRQLTFKLDLARAYRYFRLQVVANNGDDGRKDGTPARVQLGEFDLLDAAGKSLVRTPPKPFEYPASASAPLPDWAFGPFVRPAGVNPVIAPRLDIAFDCPVRKRPLKWEEGDTFNPAATVKDGKIVVLYRAEDNTFQGIGRRTSRVGYAETTDGFTMTRDAAPVLFPQEDDQKAFDWEGGCEDPRVAVTEDGLYVCTYTSWNRKVPRLCVATSRDLKTWKKHGPAFAKAQNGRWLNMGCKSGAIVQAPSKKDPSKYVIAKIDGRYVMYWGEASMELAYSDNLIDWTPAGTVMRTRRGYFDSALTEVGAAAILTEKGIVVFYNGKNSNGAGADARFPLGVYCGGQALFSATDPSKFLTRLDVPYFRPEADFERTGQYKDGTVFTEGLVFYKGKWHLYYGCADSFVGYAVWDPAAKK